MERICEVRYKGVYVDFVRADIVVDHNLVLKLKTVAKITEAHFMQLHGYMRWLPDEVVTGAVVNFNPAFRGQTKAEGAFQRFVEG